MTMLICDALNGFTFEQDFPWSDKLDQQSKSRFCEVTASLLLLASEFCIQTGSAWLLYAAPFETKAAYFLAVAFQFRRQIKFTTGELTTLVELVAEVAVHTCLIPIRVSNIIVGDRSHKPDTKRRIYPTNGPYRFRKINKKLIAPYV